MSKTKQFTQGTCEFCGELRMVDPCATEEEADQLATEQCGCPGSHAHYPSEAEQEERANKREQVLADTVQDIDELFGGGAGERGEIGISDDVRAVFEQLATFVYNKELRGVTVQVVQGVVAKISVTDKGKLTIQRNDASVRKRERT